MTAWQRLQCFARRWGADLIPTDGPTLRARTNCPFNDNVSLNYRRGYVFISNDRLGDPLVVGAAIHELAHVLASRLPPNNSIESVFLGWEYLTALETRCEMLWRASMSTYSTEKGEWDDQTFRQQRLILGLAIQEGSLYGNVVSGKPASVRCFRPLTTRAGTAPCRGPCSGASVSP